MKRLSDQSDKNVIIHALFKNLFNPPLFRILNFVSNTKLESKRKRKIDRENKIFEG